MEKENSSQFPFDLQNEQNQPYPEENQDIPPEIAMWAADLFEDAGTMGFKKKGENNVVPRIRYSGDEETVERLRSYFGGNHSHPTETTHRWTLAGNGVAHFTRVIAPFSSQRQDYVDTVQNWDRMSPPQRKTSAAAYEEMRRAKEQQKIVEMEQKANDIRLWLAGFFMIAGGMRMINGSPCMTLNRNKVDEAETLMRILMDFDPSFNRLDAYNSHQVLLIGKPVAVIARAIGDLVPSRQAFINTASLFDQPTFEGKDIKVSGKREKVEKNRYEQYISIPEVMAGIIDARGLFSFHSYQFSNKSYDTKYPILEIRSEDKELLEAIHTYYSSSKPSKDSRMNSYSIRFSTTSLLQLYNIIKPHLLLRAENAKNVIERVEPEQLNNSILIALAENLSTMSIAALQARTRRLIGIPDILPQIQLRNYVQQLMQDERIIGSLSGKGVLKFNLQHQANISIVQKSPVALVEFFQEALKNDILMSASGEILATGVDKNSLRWYKPPTQSLQRRIVRVSQSPNPLKQFFYEGRVLNYFQRILTTTDPREIKALEESIEMAFQRAYDYIIENYEDDEHLPLLQGTPKEIAQRLLTIARSK